MKNKIYLILIAFVAILCSCNSTSSHVDYLPCQVDKGEDWGFINAKGEVFCRNTFESQPTEVRDNIFFMKEGKYYSMYQFDKQKPNLLVDGIVAYGCIADGLVPICKNDSRIEIVDAKGSTKFVLDKIDDQEIISCAPEFEYGYLSICISNKDGESRYGVLDNVGNVVIYPKYHKIEILGNNLFYVQYGEDGNMQKFFIDKTEEKQSQWKDDLDIYCASEKYIIASRNNHLYVYNISGEEILNCPSKVQVIHHMKKDFFVFSSKDNDYLEGVMNMKGHVIIAAKYRLIIITDNGFIATKEDGDYRVFDTKGNLIAESDEDIIDNVEDFGNLRVGKDYLYFLNDAFKPIKKVELYNFVFPHEYVKVSSDYFDIDAVICSVKKAVESELKNKLGSPVTQLNFITSEGTSEYNSETKNVTYWFGRGVKYSVNMTFKFDEKILAPIYKDTQVAHEDWFWGTYHTTEKVIDGYKFNKNALLSKVTIECSVPDSKKEEIYKLLSSYLEEYAEYDSEGNLFKDGVMYYLSGTTIEIEPYENDDEE